MTSPQTPANTTPTRRRRFLPKTLRQWALTLLVLAILVLISSYLLIRMTPSWYAPLDPTSQRVIDLMERGQNTFDLRNGARLHNTLEAVPLGDQSFSISQDEINAMLAARRGSLPVTGPMVIFTHGKITLAARSKLIPGNNPAGGVGSVVITILHTSARSISENPTNTIKIHSAWLGCLPVPKMFVENRLPSLIPAVVSAARQEASLQAGSSKVKEIEPVVTAILQGKPLPVGSYDHRPIMVKEIRVDEGTLTIVFAPPVRPATAPTPTVR